jgi:hypothetical protein
MSLRVAAPNAQALFMIESARLVSRYWRTALADSELGRGAFPKDDDRPGLVIGGAALRAGRLESAELAKVFCGDPEEVKSRAVVLRPFAYRAQTEHGHARSNLPAVITPLVGQATVFRDGLISPSPNIAAPRDLLEPLSGFTLGTVVDLDRFLTNNPAPSTVGEGEPKGQWEAYMSYCRQLLAAVFPDLMTDKRFRAVDGGYIEVTGGGKGAGEALIALYDALENDKPDVPLFETAATAPLRQPEPCLPHGAMFAERLGHSNAEYPLALGQQEAISHLLAADHGDIVAVNGPPGTGKTTLLLSVVATLWARAALAGGEPPVIIAASTNNQAVTNIIDAFGTDFATGVGPFAGRWLPEVASFGSYFPARSRQASANRYQTVAFFNGVEDSNYLDRAEQAFLKAGAIAFPALIAPTVEQVVEALHGLLQTQASALRALEASWAALQEARRVVRTLLGDDSEGVLADLRRAVDEAKEEVRAAEALAETWEAYQGGEPFWLLLFAWAQPIAMRRLHRARASLRGVWAGPLPDWKTVSDISSTVTALTQGAGARLEQRRAELNQAERVLEAERACLEGWAEALDPVEVARSEAASWTLGMCDPVADRLIRFPIFLTTTHYWEGRWLLDVKAIADLANEKPRTGRKWLTARWWRRMKLTPCAVSTFYSLPGLFKGKRHDQSEFVADYLWDFIDLLIVDEAGQATAEVGGGAFALAQRALVIGDTKQIPPIWNVPERVDQANLTDLKLLTQEDLRSGRNPLAEAGRAASSGSVMRMSQQASRYHQDPDLARGLMLHEHRRCFDEIIGYSNALCYASKLKPMRGSKARAPGAGADGLPALGYAHIDGRCDKIAGGSCRNLAEAHAITAWLTQQKGTLEAAYPGKPLDEIVCVIAPFAGQVRAISTAWREAGNVVGGAGGLAIGTVHNFQGAQRPVVLFSPTYSKHVNGVFIDHDPSLLNVAVSRAQNSFLVFGDMDLLSGAPSGSPRALLGRFLFADEANRLVVQQPFRADLLGEEGVTHLRDAAAHDAFLLEVLAGAQRDIHIVSPWVARRVIGQTELGAAMTAAAGRGVAITIYTDGALNADRASRARSGMDDYRVTLEFWRSTGAEVVEVNNVHSKIVMSDDQLHCVGSFNWLSASREGIYTRAEESMVYRSRKAAGEIAIVKDDLGRRAQGKER